MARRFGDQMRAVDAPWLRRASTRALLLVLVWVSAGLWDVAHVLEHEHEHVLEHEHDQRTAVAGQAALENEGPALMLAARQGHAHSHPPDEQPVIGSGKGHDLDVPSLPVCVDAIVVEQVRTGRTPRMAPVASAQVTVAATGPRGPPIS